ncbi:MAG: hypothetical protein JWL89_75 [Candidatus Saccharibacteria bacterium]|nr:hypothetical protein [Candidatus Saccharibacteria bacterium]
MANNDEDNDDVDQADVDAVLIEVDFPATRDELVVAAQDADADQAIIVLFQELPDEEYASQSDVNNAINNRSGGKDRS